MTLDDFKEIFYSKFENPVESEPYDSSEGGYLNADSFIDTDDAVAEIKCPENIRLELIGELNKLATRWVRKNET